MMDKRDAVIIGGGPSGLAAASALYAEGIKNIVIIEREDRLGGILKQCIHDGFGLERFGESLTGPEYADRLIQDVESNGIECILSSPVLSISPDKVVTFATSEGMRSFEANAVILTVGCKERDRGAIAIPGERPAGVFTAGTAQSYINIYNRLPGHEAVILGSGDIGLIMARRLTLEGVKVHAVFEIQDHPNGLERNIIQCLDDYDIPLYLNHTVTDIHGGSRLTGVTVSEVDENLTPIPGTEKEYSCDTLILSVGLLPDNSLLVPLDAELDPMTRGASVDENLMTSISGIFVAGNALHVHDLADYAALEAERLATSVVSYIKGEVIPDENIEVIAGDGVGSIVPERVSGKKDVTFTLRPSREKKDAVLSVLEGDSTIMTKKFRRVQPQEMISITLPSSSFKEGNLEVRIS